MDRKGGLPALPTAGPSSSSSRKSAKQSSARSSGGGGAPGKRSRSETAERDDSDTETSSAPALRIKRKRNRAALSCTACKKRKIKCDRKLPCEACIKRGEQGLCRWEQPKVEPPPQPFALAVEHEQLKQRVAVLEAVLRRLVPGVYEDIGEDVSELPVLPPPTVSSYKAEPVEQGVEEEFEEVDEEVDEEMDELAEEEEPASDGENVEDAALVLEELALQHATSRMSSRSRTKSASARRSSSTYVLHGRVPASPLPSSLSYTFSPSPSTAHSSPPAPRHVVHGQGSDDAAEGFPSRAMASLIVPPIDSRRRAILESIYASLPQRKSEIDWMLRNYFERVDWAWHLHHKPTFLAEYDAFCTLRAQNRLAEIDPLWLACFAMTLCLSVNSLSAPVSTPLVSIAASDLETLPWRLLECAQSALECGDWTGRPRFRTLQAIVLFAPFFLFAGNRASAERHQTYIGAALRMAQSMGLHTLGDDPETMPVLSEEDELYSGLPPGVNTLKREMALRMLATLLFLDYTSLRIKTSLPPHLVTSALPGNYNDVDLSPIHVVPPRHADQVTDVSLDLVKFRLALEQRKFKVMMEGAQSFKYEAVAEIDANYRAILDSLPTELAEGYIPPLGEPLTSLWRRNMAIQSVQSRILRLHRPWMGRGLTNERYGESTAKALASARSVLACQVSLESAPMLKQGFQLLTVQMAVITLFMSLFHSQSASVPASQLTSTRERDDDDLAQITSTFPYLSKHLSSRVLAVRTVASSSLAAFKLLLRAYERRREGTATPLERQVGFEALLGRVGRTVEQAEKTGVDPLVAAEMELGGQDGFVSPAAVLASSRTASVSAPASTSGLFAPTTSGGDEPGSPHAWSETSSLTEEPPDLNDDFDLAVLEGPEYADPTFSWDSHTALGQFASLGTF